MSMYRWTSNRLETIFRKEIHKGMWEAYENSGSLYVLEMLKIEVLIFTANEAMPMYIHLIRIEAKDLSGMVINQVRCQEIQSL